MQAPSALTSSASSTGERGGSSPTTPTSAGGPTSSRSRQKPSPGEVDWTKLSESATWTLRNVALRLSLGFSEAEVARALGLKRREVDELLDELAAELER